MPCFQHIPNFITSIHTMGNRIVVADVQESFHFLRYRRQENQLIIFADDTSPRWISCAALLDYDTMAGADKFGNLIIVSLILGSGREFASWPGHTKDHHKNGTNCLPA